MSPIVRPPMALRLRELRLARKWSMEELAYRVGVSKETIRLWENGRAIRPRHAAKLEQVFELEQGLDAGFVRMVVEVPASFALALGTFASARSLAPADAIVKYMSWVMQMPSRRD